jgi:hypothetical protein
MSTIENEDWTPEDEAFDEDDYTPFSLEDEDWDAYDFEHVALTENYDDDFEYDEDFYDSQDWEPTDA